MSFDFDGFNDYLPVKGQVANALQSDGNVWNQVTFLATLGTAINNATASWKIEESADGSTYVDVTSTKPAIFRTKASGTSTAFHCSVNSKAAYVKATLMDDGSAASGATYAALLGHPSSGPFLGSQIAGIEDGYTVAPTQ